MLITVDTLRPDRLSTYGYTKQRTAAIDSIAADGARFETAVCDIPWTTGSMASVMTGTFSVHHGVHLPTERLADSQTTLAEVLKAKGFQTGAVVGSFPVSSLFGLAQGFDTYDEEFTRAYIVNPQVSPVAIHKVPMPKNMDDMAEMGQWAMRKMVNDSVKSDAEVTEHTIRWLKEHSAERFFLWVHYFGPHERLFMILNAPPSAQEPRMVSEYDGDLQVTDAAIARLLSAVDDMGLTRRLLVILHSDHGQSLGEHGYVGHGNDLYDASVRVPMLVRFPDRVKPGTKVTTPVRNVDIMPTILDFLDVPVPAGLDGRSLKPALTGGSLKPLPAYSETYSPTLVMWPLQVPPLNYVLAPVSRHSLRTDDQKLIDHHFSPPCQTGTSPYRNTTPERMDFWELNDVTTLPEEQCKGLVHKELYDLHADPGETKDLAQQRPDLVVDLQSQLTATMEQRGKAEALELSPGDKERLRSLGYHPGNE